MRYWNVQEQLVDVLGREKRDIQNLLTCAVLDPELRDTVDTLLRAKAVKRGIKDPGNPPAFGFADELEKGDLILGRVKVGDNVFEAVGLADRGKSPGHTAILGKSRMGKSTLAKWVAAQAIERGDKIFALVRDNEWRDLLPLFPPEKLLYLLPADLKLNPLEPPEGSDGKPVISPVEWAGELQLIVRATLFTRDVAGGLFSRCLVNLYREKGVFRGTQDYPTLSDLRDLIRALPVGSGRRLNEAKDTLVNRLDMLLLFLGEGLNVKKSRSVGRLFSHSIILDMSNVEETVYQFFFAWLVTLLKTALPQEF